MIADVDSLDLQGLDEALRLGVVIRTAATAHGSEKAVTLEPATVRGCGILRAAIGMEHATRQRSSGFDRRVQGTGCQSDIDIPPECMADDFPRPGIKNDGQTSESGCYRNAGHVADPELVGAMNFAIPGEGDGSRIWAGLNWSEARRRVRSRAGIDLGASEGGGLEAGFRLTREW